MRAGRPSALLIRLREFGSAFGDVKHVELFALGGNQHQVDVAAVLRDDAADAIQQPEGIRRDESRMV